MESRGQIERRKHRRVQVQDIAFAVLRDPDRQLGQIMDISMGGLAYNYIVGSGNADRAFELDILLAYKGLYMEKIQFVTISDFQIANKSPFTPITMRRRGIKFDELTPKQTSMLQNFIKERKMNCMSANPMIGLEDNMGEINQSL
jgi:c-di-GMP-binding flagellar brake protein YcgR